MSEEIVKRKRWLNLERREAITAYLLLLPVIVFFVLFHYYPMIASFIMSFFKFDPMYDTHPFVGFGNYIKLAQDRIFVASIRNTVVFTIAKVSIGATLSLILALALNKGLRFFNFYKVAFFTPVVTSMVAVCIVWQWIYQPRVGILNYILGLVGLGPYIWLASEKLALPAVTAMSIWKDAGFHMVIFMAGLKSIPEVYYEVAQIDGASRTQNFWFITLPLLKPMILLVLVTSMISSFQVFTQVYVMTEGGPMDATRTIVYTLYEHGFRYFHMGYASSMAFVLLIFILTLTLIQMKVLRTD